MRVILMGSHGMLGTEVDACLAAVGHEVVKPRTKITDQFSILDLVKHSDAIVNCAGVISQKSIDPTKMIIANALGPHILAQYGLPLLHVSTDCVFDGTLPLGQQYTTQDVPNATDIYGRTKALGEVRADNVCNVRTSFIGYNHGLLKWLMVSTKVDGWRNTAWSGSTVKAVAYKLVEILPYVVSGVTRGIIHLSTEQPISKLTLLEYLVGTLDLGAEITPVDLPSSINRALEPDFELPYVWDAEL